MALESVADSLLGDIPNLERRKPQDVEHFYPGTMMEMKVMCADS